MGMSVIEWLLDWDPSIRWQVLRDLVAESDAAVARERSRVAGEGWGARLLDLQGSDGHWGGAAFVPRAWISTTDTLQLLRDLGVDPTSDRVRAAIGRVRERCTWGEEFGHPPFFEGEVEPCINGRVLAIGAYFGEASDGLADRLLQEQLSDGGWNCDAPRSQRSPFTRRSACSKDCWSTRPDVNRARPRGEERSPRTTPVQVAIDGRDHRHRSQNAEACRVDPVFSFPTRRHYNILSGLDYLHRAAVA